MITDSKQLMADAKFYESYSRYDDNLKRYETWDEAVERVMNMHKFYYKDKLTPELLGLITEVEDAYKDKLFLGSQRALQFGGEQLLKNHNKLYNCTASYIDRVEVFGEIFHLMLSGCGVGFSVQSRHISNLPKLAKRSDDTVTVVVEDSIEGWAHSVDALLSSYFVGGGKHPEFNGKQINFDLSQIRIKGAMISGGFKAPGPEGLRKALDKIEIMLTNFLKDGYTQMTSIIAYDIIMFISDAVISGGVRRSASICLFSPDDDDMLKAKTGDWWQTNPQRGRSNNSVVLLRGITTKEEFDRIMVSVKDFGEPGFIWVDDLDSLYNPCVTGDTSVMTSDGPRLVNDLIGKKFKAIVNGGEFDTTDKGFWKTGTKKVFKVMLKNGLSVKATDNHKILTDSGWKEVKDLNQHMDKVIFHNHVNTSYWGDIEDADSDFEKGWLLGNLVGDGTFDKKSAILRYWHDDTYLVKIANKYLNNNFKTYQQFGANANKYIVSISSVKLAKVAATYGIVRKDKLPSHKLEEGSRNLYIGYLRGLMDADGSVQGDQKKGISIRLSQNNLELLEQAQRMLLRLGIVSKIYKTRRAEGYYSLPDGNGGYEEYLCKTIHELVITNESLFKYADVVGFHNKQKGNSLERALSRYVRKPNKDKFQSDVASVVYVGVEDVYDVTVPGPDAFDANGLYVHNCVEIGLYSYTHDGRTGFSVCNLTEINGGKSTSKAIFLHQCKVAAIMGTLQAGYTDFKFLSKETKEIVEREALLGSSITGWMNNPNILFDKETLEAGATLSKYYNGVVADMIGINHAARITTVKPSGNASVLLGTASGIHGEHSKTYIRHVQFNKESEIAKLFMEEFPAMVEQSVWGEHDIVVAFPIVPKEGSVYKKDLFGKKQLDFVLQAQRHWVNNGKNHDLCVKPWLSHNVSNTITVENTPEAWHDVADYIYENRNDLCGVSLLAGAGDKAYVQAPFTEVLTSDEILSKYGENSMFTSALIEAALTAFKDDLWNAINTALGFGEKLTEGSSDLLKRDFVRRFTKFSKRFKDMYDCADCLKDVYNLHKLVKINGTLKDFNWENKLTEKRYTDADTIVAEGCAGGQCDIK